MTNFQINLEEGVLQQAVAIQLIKGELGDKIAEKLAEYQAEIMTFTRTQAAELMNKSRPTIYELERAGKLKFSPDNTISLKALRDFRRAEMESEDSEDLGNVIERQPARKKKRNLR